jgi:formate--tetrahydrofolate ligase
LEKGVENLLHLLNVVKKSGIKPVVCINAFHTDTKDEIAFIRKAVEGAGGRCALSEHWAKGGEGALELTDAVIDACEEKVDFKFLYPLDMPLRRRVEQIAREVYGADGVSWTPVAEQKAKRFESDKQFNDYYTMMVKTHLSLTHDPTLKGVPKGWTLPIRDILLFSGAKFLCPMAGDIKLMPGTSSDPAYRKVDVDVNTGAVQGLF